MTVIHGTMFLWRYLLVGLTSAAFIAATVLNLSMLLGPPMRNAPIGIGVFLIFMIVAWGASLAFLIGAFLLFRNVAFWTRLPLTRQREWLVLAVVLVGVGCAQVVSMILRHRHDAYFAAERSDALVEVDDAVALARLRRLDPQDWAYHGSIDRAFQARFAAACEPLTPKRVELLKALGPLVQEENFFGVFRAPGFCAGQPDDVRTANLELLLVIAAPRLTEWSQEDLERLLVHLPDPGWAQGVLAGAVVAPPKD